MKKVFASFLSLVLALGVFCLPTKAAVDETALQDSYEKVKAYYESYYSNTEIQWEDEVILLESLGLDAEDFDVNLANNVVTELELEGMSDANISKLIIAKMLLKEDPKNVNGIDLVAYLESDIDENGRFKKGGSTPYANGQLWCLLALESVKSPYVEVVADALVAMQWSNGTFSWEEEIGNTWGVSLDITGWCIEALALTQNPKYNESIAKAVTYLINTQQSKANWASVGGAENINSQACILEGLLAYNRTGVLAGDYDKANHTVFDLIFNHQLSDGSFSFYPFDPSDSSEPQPPYSSDPWATKDTARMLGKLFNGSIVARAQSEYATWKDSNVLKSNPKNENTVVENKNNGPKTGDSHSAESLLLVMGICLCVMIRRGYAQN